ncbi:hypothetical protein [Bacteroides sp. 14(A)]|uniref:hypothetical protein n=1 Tax=Bacteroides sp. 14(A) TaxID=1163670 RepID=UPI000493E4D9|nr:hypothetical protein [Bacteroides sp. 14(A)]
MRTIEMEMINGSKTNKLKIVMDYTNKECYLKDVDGTTVINLANVRIPFACPEEVFITEAVDKYIGVIRDFIIEGLTGCYVEYDENGKEIFIPKELK